MGRGSAVGVFFLTAPGATKKEKKKELSNRSVISFVTRWGNLWFAIRQSWPTTNQDELPFWQLALISNLDISNSVGFAQWFITKKGKHHEKLHFLMHLSPVRCLTGWSHNIFKKCSLTNGLPCTTFWASQLLWGQQATNCNVSRLKQFKGGSCLFDFSRWYL